MGAIVLGGGAWGTALSLILHENGYKTTLCCRSTQQAELIENTRENPRLPGVLLPSGIHITSGIGFAAGAELLVVTVPSYAVREASRNIKGLCAKDCVAVSAAKGIEQGSGFRMSQIIEQETGLVTVVLSGPSHAEEAAREMATGCVAACEDSSAAEYVQSAFMNSHFRVYAGLDIIGVELAAALKNVIALCAGISDGMGFGDNTKALLITRGLAETARLGVALGGKKETFAGLAGMGDMIVTCTSRHSRNHSFGVLLGQGMEPKEALMKVGAVVEGYYAARSAMELSVRAGVEMPICEGACRILYNGETPARVMNDLMNRAKKYETEESWI